MTPSIYGEALKNTVKITGDEEFRVPASLCSLQPYSGKLCYASASEHSENHLSGLMGSGSAAQYTEEVKNPAIPTFYLSALISGCYKKE